MEFRLNWVRKHQQTILMRSADDEGPATNNISSVDHFHGEAQESGEYVHGDTDYPQNTTDASNYLDLYPAEGDTPTSSKKNIVVLPGSFQGSRRHLSHLARNALTIVSEHGKPTFFITITCNANWPEIQERLLEGNSAFDVPTVVCMVFHQRLKAFLHNLRHGKYFGKQYKLRYIMHVIEYQHRGLPHAHVSVKFDGVPEEPSEEDLKTKSPEEIALMRKKVIDFIDEHISCEMRQPGPNGEPLSEQDAIYNTLIQDLMMHKCCTAEANGCKKTFAHPCKRGFDAYTDSKATTHIDNKGMARYRRRNINTDRYVVAHNELILRDMQCHVNVEYAGTSTQVIYLYKYLFKGVSKITTVIRKVNDDDSISRDEILQYLETRVLCSMDAAWRLLGFHTYPVPYPSVRVIKVKLESQLNAIMKDHQTCDLQLYLKRPIALNEFKYTELFTYFTMVPKKRLSTAHQTLPNSCNAASPYKLLPTSPTATSATASALEESFDDDILEGVFQQNADVMMHKRFLQGTATLKPHLKYKIPMDILGTKQDWYMIPRMHPEAGICRLEMVPLTAGELWFLRLILLNEHPISLLEDAKFCPDKNNPGKLEEHALQTFQAKAIAMGYVKDTHVAMTAFEQCIESGYHTPKELRGLFAVMTLNGFPTLMVLETKAFYDHMIEDILHWPKVNGNAHRARQALLRDLQKRITSDGGTMVAYDLPMPEIVETELQEEREKYDKASQEAEFKRLDALYPNNPEQESIANQVSHVVHNPNPDGGNFFFIDGKGGCGKTTLCKKLQAKFRAEGKVVKVCASIGVACLLYEDALTAHSLFKFPVHDDDGEDFDGNGVQSCKLHESENRHRFELLMHTDVIFWDEFPSNHLQLFEAVQRALASHKKLVFVCIGDFAQILPVVKFGTPDQVLAVLITSSVYWEKFTILQLKTNMRLAGLHAMEQQEGSNAMTKEERDEYHSQKDYKACIDAVALGFDDVVFSEVTFTTDAASGDENRSVISWAANCQQGPIERKITTVLPKMDYFAEDCGEKDLDWIASAADTPDAVGIGANLYTEEDLNALAIAAMINEVEATPAATSIPPFDPAIETSAVQQAIEFLYPHGYSVDRAKQVCILAATNKRVEQWNKWVQDLNQETVYVCKSHDFLSDVDDPHGHLRRCINTHTMNKFHNIAENPPHLLELKKNDIVISMRSMMCQGIATNTRMRILDIVTEKYKDKNGVTRETPIVLRVETIGDNPHIAFLPRIRFKVKAGQHSFTMTRTQFPIRLAYAVTYNKSQSQTLHTVLVDTTQQPFAHGHLYVALSRVRYGSNIRLFIFKDQLHPGDPTSTDKPPGPSITNVVYPSVLINN